MKPISGKSLLGVIAVSACLVWSPASVLAQQKELTVEELEKYIEQQKAELEEVLANREQTEAKAQAVRDALAEQEARQLSVEEELEKLCNEREVLEPGTYDECMAQSNN